MIKPISTYVESMGWHCIFRSYYKFLELVELCLYLCTFIDSVWHLNGCFESLILDTCVNSDWLMTLQRPLLRDMHRYSGNKTILFLYHTNGTSQQTFSVLWWGLDSGFRFRSGLWTYDCESFCVDRSGVTRHLNKFSIDYNFIASVIAGNIIISSRYCIFK